jgi:pimeloyl-ACP methyl ester carboxylesterase
MRATRLLPLLLWAEMAWAQPAAEKAPAAEPKAQRPEVSFTPGVPVSVPVPGDKPLYVIHAAPEVTRPIVYLHGWCGRPEAPEAFKQAAARHGTLISLTAELECPNGRTRWHKQRTGAQHERIQRALSVVREARGGALDPEKLVLFGYSQGAARAYRLAMRFPSAYPRLVLGGPPERPAPGWFPGARAIAVLGGERETTEAMRDGTAALQEAGKLARYFLIPSARHGDFGPQAEPLMDEVFSWLTRVAP